MASFLLPITLGILYINIKKKTEDVHPISFGIDSPRALSMAATLAPSLAIIISAAALTELVFKRLGIPVPEAPDEVFWVALIMHALLPSILEELLFRYLPIRLLTPRSPKTAVLVSAVLFALAHGSLFKIPYALVAGLIFAALDIYFGSLLPSLIIHLLNNLLSLLSTYGYLEALPPSLIYSAAAGLTALSVIYLATVKHHKGGSHGKGNKE
jgi:membrane protease YdiL (CAAX protease family)